MKSMKHEDAWNDSRFRRWQGMTECCFQETLSGTRTRPQARSVPANKGLNS
ncbi:hypothetical protein ABID20_001339 [Rhizobium alvei]